MDKTFICMESDQGELFFVSLYQIVKADIVSDDEIILHLSDGTAFQVNGKDAVGKLRYLLGENAMNLDGEPLTDMAARLRAGESKIRLIKAEDLPADRSETKTPPAEE